MLFGNYKVHTVWKLEKYPLSKFWKNFVNAAVFFNVEVTKQLISRNFYSWEWISRFSTLWSWKLIQILIISIPIIFLGALTTVSFSFASVSFLVLLSLGSDSGSFSVSLSWKKALLNPELKKQCGKTKNSLSSKKEFWNQHSIHFLKWKCFHEIFCPKCLRVNFRNFHTVKKKRGNEDSKFSNLRSPYTF